jgi:hypothetical protein
MSRGKRFESARRLSRNLHKQAEFSLQGKAVLFSVTPGDAEGWFAHCTYGSGDQYS